MNESLFKRNQIQPQYLGSTFSIESENWIEKITDQETRSTVLILNINKANGNNVKLFQEYLDEIIINESNRIIIDFDNVKFIDPVFAGTLIQTLKKIKDAGGFIKLIINFEKNPHIFSINNLHKLIEIYPNLFEAISSIKKVS